MRWARAPPLMRATLRGCCPRQAHHTQGERSMSAINVSIHAVGTGSCVLTGKEGEGLTVTFEDGTTKESFMSWKAFRQILAMKAAQTKQTNSPPSGALVTRNSEE